MTLAGAAVVPSAPILVPGMSQSPPPELAEVREAVTDALAALAPSALLLVLAAAPDAAPDAAPADTPSGTPSGTPSDTPAPGHDRGGIYVDGIAHLGPLSRPDVAASFATPRELAVAAADATGLTLRSGPPPVDLAALVLLALSTAGTARGTAPVALLPIAVPWAGAEILRGLAGALGRALHGTRAGGVALLTAGDLAAGLTEKAPRHLVPGSQEWTDAAVDALSRGDGERLGELGPGEARRVGARAWPSLVAAQALLDAEGVKLRRRLVAAPRGVAYLVATA